MDPRTSTLPADRHRIGAPANLCPFGCAGKQLNENGYCAHLVGFTLDGVEVELREAFGILVQGVAQTSHFERVGAKVGPVEPTDLLVEVSNGRKVPTPTRRVYRPGPGDRRVERSNQEQTQTIDNLMAVVAQQQKQLDELKAVVTA